MGAMASAPSMVTTGSQKLDASATTARTTAFAASANHARRSAAMASAPSMVTTGSQKLDASATTARTTAFARCCVLGAVNGARRVEKSPGGNNSTAWFHAHAPRGRLLVFVLMAISYISARA